MVAVLVRQDTGLIDGSVVFFELNPPHLVRLVVFFLLSSTC
jgi:hypothetical protein